MGAGLLGVEQVCAKGVDRRGKGFRQGGGERTDSDGCEKGGNVRMFFVLCACFACMYVCVSHHGHLRREENDGQLLITQFLRRRRVHVCTCICAYVRACVCLCDREDGVEFAPRRDPNKHLGLESRSDLPTPGRPFVCVCVRVRARVCLRVCAFV